MAVFRLLWSIATLILSLLTLPVPTRPQAVQIHGCAYNYTLRAEDSCVRSSHDSYSTCVDLSAFLESFNSQSYGSDCVQFSLEPGVYSLSSTHAAEMTYSVVMSGSSAQEVTISCLDFQPPSDSSEEPEYFAPLTFGGNQADRLSVVLEGIGFDGCNRPLQFDYLQTVTIDSCVFQGYTESAVDLFNVNNIEIRDSTFNNCTTEIGKPRFRGNSGAVSIAYYTTQSTRKTIITPPVAIITNNIFTNNRAILPPEISRTQLNQALNNNIYYGRGGAVGIFVQESFHNVTATIADNLFYNNLAESFGGALYLFVAGENTTHYFSVNNTNFTRNEGGDGSYGGAIQIALLVQNINFPPSQFDIIGCHFEENVAEFGGGFSAVQTFSQGEGNLVSIMDSVFVRNRARVVGSAVLFASFLYVQNRFESHHYRCHNNLFSNNSAPGGTFGVSFIPTDFSGLNRLEFNEGPGLRIVGSVVEILSGGTLSFIGNNAESREGGALFMQDFGQVKLYSNSSMEFINNTGRIGSAIVVNVQRSSRVFSQLIFNPQCFLIHENETLAPQNWTDVSILFSGNRASVGPAVYISHLDHCSWYSVFRANTFTNEIHVTFSIGKFTDWPVFEFTEGSNTATSIRDAPRASTYYFQTEPVKITSSNGTTPVRIRPGEQGRLNLMGVDQFGNPAYVIVRLSDSRVAINNGAFSQAGTAARVNTTDLIDLVQFEPSLLPIQPSDQSVTVLYGFPSPVQEFHDNEVVKIILDTPYNVRSSEQFVFNLSLVPCQPGFELRKRTDGDGLVSCLCVRDTLNILNCEEDVIILRDGHWGVEEREPTPHLDLTPCPASYCRCHFRGGQTCETLFFQDDPTMNLQCHPLRNGTLCGSCINGTGVGVLRTNCRQCNRDNYFALGFLVVGDAIIVTLVLVLAVKAHMVFPSSLKGLLYYVQTVYYATEYFPIQFWNIRKYMLFISSAVGLYFPWDFCLFPGMTPLVSFAPKFTPPALATLASVIAIIAVYVTRSRAGREYVWHGVWTLTLLLYAPLAHTCLSLLHCRYTPSADGTEEDYHWYLDGAVRCFDTPGHLALGIISILTLLLLIALVPSVLVFSVLASSKKLQSKSRTIGWMYNALTYGYRDSWEAKWWSSFELLRRLLLVSIAIALPGRSVANLYVLLNVLAIHMFFKPYIKLWVNVLETVVLLMYALTLMIRATPTFLDTLAPYSGIEVPENWDGDLTYTDGVTWLLFPFFYLPVLVGVVFITSAAVYLTVRAIRVRVQYKWKARRPTISGNENFVEINDYSARNVNYTRTDVGLDDL